VHDHYPSPREQPDASRNRAGTRRHSASNECGTRHSCAQRLGRLRSVRRKKVRGALQSLPAVDTGVLRNRPDQDVSPGRPVQTCNGRGLRKTRGRL